MSKRAKKLADFISSKMNRLVEVWYEPKYGVLYSELPDRASPQSLGKTYKQATVFAENFDWGELWSEQDFQEQHEQEYMNELKG